MLRPAPGVAAGGSAVAQPLTAPVSVRSPQPVRAAGYSPAVGVQPGMTALRGSTAPRPMQPPAVAATMPPVVGPRLGAAPTPSAASKQALPSQLRPTRHSVGSIPSSASSLSPASVSSLSPANFGAASSPYGMGATSFGMANGAVSGSMASSIATTKFGTAGGAIRPATANTMSFDNAVATPLGLRLVPPSNQEADGFGTVLCFGDSLTAGIRAGDLNYPSILEGLLQKAGYKLKVRNTGNWGDNCQQLLTRFPYVINDQAQRGRIAFVLILGGTNDIIRGGFYCSELLEKLGRLHDIAGSAPGAPPVGVLTLPPADIGKPVKEQARLRVNEMLRESCQSNPSRFLVELETVPASMLTDRLHFSPEGNREFAERAFQAMLPFLAEWKGDGA